MKLQIIKTHRLDVSIKFEPRDLWIGVYWTGRHYGFDVFICVVPCLPLVIAVATR